MRHYWNHFPRYMAYQVHPWETVAYFWPFYWRCIPRQQKAAILILTMGKVGTLSVQRALNDKGHYFSHVIHRLSPRSRNYPHDSRPDRQFQRTQRILRRPGFRWLLRRPQLRVVTSVREPISRIISLYLFAYPRLFGSAVEDTSMDFRLARFPQVFE